MVLLFFLFFQLNADIYENDPELQKIREERGYSYMDIITIHPDKLPDYGNKVGYAIFIDLVYNENHFLIIIPAFQVKMFYEEHLHVDDEIRYILDGSSYFDVRDKDDRWIRLAVSKGDLITLPAGIYHRFTVDESVRVFMIL